MVSGSTNSTTGAQMSVYEGLLIASMGFNAWALFRLGKAEKDVEMLYEGVAMCMTKLGIAEK
jgi:hypothetical protein